MIRLEQKFDNFERMISGEEFDRKIEETVDKKVEAGMREQRVIDKQKDNIVIVNLPESVQKTNKEQNEEDMKKIREIMNEVVEELREEDLTQLVRLGDRKNSTLERPRMLKLKVKNEEKRREILKKARRREGQNPTLDDWVLISDDGLASNVEHEDPLGKSDHEVLTFNLNITINKMKEDNKYSFNLNKGNYDKMREVLRDYDWDCIVDDDIDEMWNKLKEVISGEMLKCIPKAKSKNKSGNPIWMNQKAMRSIKKKYNSYKRFLRSKTGYDYLKYIKDRNQCTKSLKQARKDYERNIAKNSKTNPKQFWKYIQNKIKINAGIGTLRKPDGSIATSDQDKADTLNSFLQVFLQKKT